MSPDSGLTGDRCCMSRPSLVSPCFLSASPTTNYQIKGYSERLYGCRANSNTEHLVSSCVTCFNHQNSSGPTYPGNYKVMGWKGWVHTSAAVAERVKHAALSVDFPPGMLKQQVFRWALAVCHSLPTNPLIIRRKIECNSEAQLNSDHVTSFITFYGIFGCIGCFPDSLNTAPEQ